MNENQEEINDSEVSGFEPLYTVEFLYEELPNLSSEKLLTAMETYTGAVKVSDAAKHGPTSFELEAVESQPLIFFHLNHKVTYDDGDVVTAQSCIYEPHNIQETNRFDSALQQSFHWQNASATISNCKYSVRVHDLFAEELPYKERFELILGVVQAILECTPCKAIFWHTSDKLVEPNAYLKAVEQGEKLYGAVNLRLYSTGKEKEMIMDTLGLSALGIPDLQCHFYDLDPSGVGRDLLVISKYLYDQGDIIHDGESIGTSSNKAYLCEHQHALVVPPRVVLDLNAHDANQLNNLS
ncbi:DUF4261 domain-containing protein [Paenibacillus glacialis]|nr:DUF4261 domain-containing protein [Paenibacillus glacialis]